MTVPGVATPVRCALQLGSDLDGLLQHVSESTGVLVSEVRGA